MLKGALFNLAAHAVVRRLPVVHGDVALRERRVVDLVLLPIIPRVDEGGNTFSEILHLSCGTAAHKVEKLVCDGISEQWFRSHFAICLFHLRKGWIRIHVAHLKPS